MRNLDCRIRDLQPKYNEDCYWFSRWQDMGASIPQCGKAPMGVCHCTEKCTLYISRDDVVKMVEEYQKGNGC